MADQAEHRYPFIPRELLKSDCLCQPLTIMFTVFIASLFMIALSVYVYLYGWYNSSFGQMIIAMVMSYIFAIIYPFMMYSMWKKINVSGIYLDGSRITYALISQRIHLARDCSITVQTGSMIDIVLEDSEQSISFQANWVGCHSLDHAKEFVRNMKTELGRT